MPRRSPHDHPPVAEASLRLRPPDDLNELEREAFTSAVLAAPKGHLTLSDLPLLSAYSRAIVAEKVAAGELAAAPVVDGKPSPWLPIWQANLRALTTTARMLQLNPAGRQPLPASRRSSKMA